MEGTTHSNQTKKLTLLKRVLIIFAAIIIVQISYGILSRIIYQTITLPRADRFMAELEERCALQPEVACVAPMAPILYYHRLTNFVAFFVLPFITWFLMTRKLKRD